MVTAGMTARVRGLLLALLVLGVVGCDQGSKELAERRLADKPAHSLVEGRLELSYHQNRGMAFNAERALPRGARTPAVVIGALAVLGLVGFAWYRRRGAGRMVSVGFSLVVAGALGNLLDRALRGYVVDFVHLRGWPVFNVADVAIAVGAGLLVVASLRSGDRAQTA